MVGRRQYTSATTGLVLALLLNACASVSGPASGMNRDISGLERVPWEGGPDYWSNFPSAQSWSDPSMFPIGLWYGSAEDSSRVHFDKSLGINFYTGGLWEGTQFPNLENEGMYWVGGRVNDTFVETSRYWPGLVLDDEVDGRFSEPSAGLAYLESMRSKAENGRQFLYANFTNMVVGPELSRDARLRYVNDFADVISLDMYFYTVPFCKSTDNYRGHLYESGVYAGGILRPTCRTSSSYGRFTSALRKLDSHDGELVPIWNFIELLSGAGEERSFSRYISPDEIRGAVMSSLINEARGIVWFQQSFGGPCATSQPLRDAQRQGPAFCGYQQVHAMKDINKQVQDLAPILNTQSLGWDAGHGVQTMLKVSNSQAYLFAITDGIPGVFTLRLPEGLGNTAIVIGENRSVSISGNSIVDNFPSENSYHIYKIAILE